MLRQMGTGLALKVEDGSRRAKHAVSYTTKTIRMISDLRIQDIEEKVFNFISQELKLKVN